MDTGAAPTGAEEVIDDLGYDKALRAAYIEHGLWLAAVEKERERRVRVGGAYGADHLDVALPLLPPAVRPGRAPRAYRAYEATDAR